MTAAMTAMKGRRLAISLLPGPVLRRLGRSAFLQFRQRQIRHDALPVLADDDLVRILQHLFHGFDEQALARDVGRLGVFVVDGDEALRLAFRFLHDAVLVGGRLFADLRRLAARLAELLVGILVRFLDETVLVLLGALHLVEGVGHFARRRRVLDRDRVDREPGAVVVERRLDDPRTASAMPWRSSRKMSCAGRRPTASRMALSPIWRTISSGSATLKR